MKDKKRFLYLPLIAKGGADEQKDLAKALAERFDLQVIDYMVEGPSINEKLIRLADEWKPHVIHCQFQENDLVKPATLAYIKNQHPTTIISQWTGDVRPRIIKSMVEIGKVIDVTLFSNKSQLMPYWKEIQKPVGYWQNAVGEDWLVDNPPGGPWITFCGTNLYNPSSKQQTFSGCEERHLLTQALYQEFRERFRLFGNGWGIPGATVLPWRGQPKVYSESAVVIGHNHINDLVWYQSDRTFIAMAAGRPYLCRHTPGMEELFHDGVHCLYWTTIKECVDRIKWCLANPNEASKIGLRGQQVIREGHTWKVRINELIQLLGIKV